MKPEASPRHQYHAWFCVSRPAFCASREAVTTDTDDARSVVQVQQAYVISAAGRAIPMVPLLSAIKCLKAIIAELIYSSLFLLLFLAFQRPSCAAGSGASGDGRRSSRRHAIAPTK